MATKRKSTAGQASLTECLAFIKKSFNESIITNFSESSYSGVESWKTRFPTFNDLSGINGIPQGKIVELFGNESVGKSSLALGIAASVQKQDDRSVLWLDYETSFSPGYAKLGGMDTEDKFLFSQPDTIENGFEIINTLADNDLISLVVLDSLASAPTKKDMEAEIGESQMGQFSKTISQSLRQLSSKLSKKKVTLIFINQLRSNMSSFGYGKKYETPGGKAVKFYSALRIQMRRIGGIKRKMVYKAGVSEEIEAVTEVKVSFIKNKVAIPYREGLLYMVHGKRMAEKSDVKKLIDDLRSESLTKFKKENKNEL